MYASWRFSASLKTCKTHKQVNEIMNGVADDVEAEKGRVDDDTEKNVGTFSWMEAVCRAHICGKH